MAQLPVPIVRCELPTPDAIVVDHPEAGRFVLVDHRVSDPQLDRLLDRLEVEAELRGEPLVDDRAALLRDQIAELKAGTGIDKIEPKVRPAKTTRKGRTATTGRKRKG